MYFKSFLIALTLLSLFAVSCASDGKVENTDDNSTTFNDSDDPGSILDNDSYQVTGDQSSSDKENSKDTANDPDSETYQDDETVSDNETVYDPDNETSPDSDIDTDTSVEPECWTDNDCDSGKKCDNGYCVFTGPECITDFDCNGGQKCYKEHCRENCTMFINPCDWSATGDICESGHCVECQKDSDCPGTRYHCNTMTSTCEDNPFDPTKTKIGVFYHTWHCPSAADAYDITKLLNGEGTWPPMTEVGKQVDSFWWGEPAEGYYCLTNNEPLLKKHAEQLRDMGADFVFVDATNHPYNQNDMCDRPKEMIIEPFTSMVDAWAKVPNAPKIVPWVPVSNAWSSDTSKYMVHTMLGILQDHPEMFFIYQSKPLLLVAQTSLWTLDETEYNSLSKNYTTRVMWAFETPGTEKWSYIEKCASSPLEHEPCNQRESLFNGAPEQFPIATAYQADYMSHTNTATPKYEGRTFRHQFQTLFDNPEIPIATITGWNEWIVGRWPCGTQSCDCNNSFDRDYGCFLDAYTIDYNRDLEPSKTKMGDYYYRLATECIKLYRSGGRCDYAHSDNLCCKDYQ